MNLARVAEHEAIERPSSVTRAAVLVPIIDEDPTRLLVTKRAEDLSDHPGQMSFPGGAHEAVDANLCETASREAREEIGLDRSEIEWIGRLDDIRTVTEFVVSSFVGLIPARSYHPNDHEVAEIVIVDMDTLLNPANCRVETREHPVHGDIEVYYFDIGDQTIWGATARILSQLLDLCYDHQLPIGTSPN